MTKTTGYYDVEVTDTFGGEPNYSWVKRFTISESAVPDEWSKKLQRALVRKAKALAGWTGMRCYVDARSYSDITVTPRGVSAPCWIMFIHWDEGNKPNESDDD